MSEYTGPQVGDLIFTGRRVWVVSGVYLTGEAEAVAGNTGKVGLRYPEDNRHLERAYMPLKDIFPGMVYRQVI